MDDIKWGGCTKQSGRSRPKIGPVTKEEVAEVLSLNAAQAQMNLWTSFGDCLTPEAGCFRDLPSTLLHANMLEEHQDNLCKDEKANPKDVINWWPIAIFHALYQLYNSIVVRRLTN